MSVLMSIINEGTNQRRNIYAAKKVGGTMVTHEGAKEFPNHSHHHLSASCYRFRDVAPKRSNVC